MGCGCAHDPAAPRLEPGLRNLAHLGLQDDGGIPHFGGFGPDLDDEVPLGMHASRELSVDHPDGSGDELLAIARRSLGPGGMAFGGEVAFSGTGPGIVVAGAACCDECAERPLKSCGSCGCDERVGRSREGTIGWARPTHSGTGRPIATVAGRFAAPLVGDTRRKISSTGTNNLATGAGITSAGSFTLAASASPFVGQPALNRTYGTGDGGAGSTTEGFAPPTRAASVYTGVSFQARAITGTRVTTPEDIVPIGRAGGIYTGLSDRSVAVARGAGDLGRGFHVTRPVLAPVPQYNDPGRSVGIARGA